MGEFTVGQIVTVTHVPQTGAVTKIRRKYVEVTCAAGNGHTHVIRVPRGRPAGEAVLTTIRPVEIGAHSA